MKLLCRLAEAKDLETPMSLFPAPGSFVALSMTGVPFARTGAVGYSKVWIANNAIISAGMAVQVTMNHCNKCRSKQYLHGRHNLRSALCLYLT